MPVYAIPYQDVRRVIRKSKLTVRRRRRRRRRNKQKKASEKTRVERKAVKGSIVISKRVFIHTNVDLSLKFITTD